MTSPKRFPPGIESVRTLTSPNYYLSASKVAWSSTSSDLAAVLGGTLHVFDTTGGGVRKASDSFSGGTVLCVAFGPDQVIAGGCDDGTIVLWNAATLKLLRTFRGDGHRIVSIGLSRHHIATASSSGAVVFRRRDGTETRRLRGPKDLVRQLSFDRSGAALVGACDDRTIRVWDGSTGSLRLTLKGHEHYVYAAAVDLANRRIVSGSVDNTVRVWNSDDGMLLRVQEGHAGTVDGVAISFDGAVIVSKSGSDGTLRFWTMEGGDCVGIVRHGKDDSTRSALSCHPERPFLASVAPVQTGYSERHLIRIWRFDVGVLLKQARWSHTARYVNAKVVLVGDTGVGKSGLSLVMTGHPFRPTDSSAGRTVTVFGATEVLQEHRRQTREILLWDLAGQPGYRIIHQLHLGEAVVALVVFDARSETDPLAGVRHWERALRLAEQRQSTGLAMTKYLVSARADRGSVSVSRDRIDALQNEFGFSGYFETSAKEGWQIEALAKAVQACIPWQSLPEVSSSSLFAAIKSFLLSVRDSGRVLVPVSELFEEFISTSDEESESDPRPSELPNITEQRQQFDTCIGRLENRDLLRRLSFGGYLLLQPEVLDAYASAIVNAAKDEPDGLGSITEDVVLGGQFFVPEEHKIQDEDAEQLILYATVEELARHDLALRESAADGLYLVFPSQFNRDYEDAPEPKGKAVAITFEGPVQSLYSTLIVRLAHSGLFSTGRASMWRNAAVFSARAGGRCGIYVQEFAEGRGRLILFYESDAASPGLETRFYFEEFVVDHAKKRSIDDSVEVTHFFVCLNCGNPVPDGYVRMLVQRGEYSFNCPCGSFVSLQPKEISTRQPNVLAMEKAADQQRDFEIFVDSARGETNTPDFRTWSGADRTTLAIVFTDLVGSTALGEQLRDEQMAHVRRAHFSQSRGLIQKFGGREIKTIGDSFMAAFKNVENALDYAVAVHGEPGHGDLSVRAGVHIGPMHVEDNDVFGGTVNFAARVVGSIPGAEIWISDRAKDDLDRSGVVRHRHLLWGRHAGVSMKGFTGSFTLWALQPPA